MWRRLRGGRCRRLRRGWWRRCIDRCECNLWRLLALYLHTQRGRERVYRGCGESRMGGIGQRTIRRRERRDNAHARRCITQHYAGFRDAQELCHVAAKVGLKQELLHRSGHCESKLHSACVDHSRRGGRHRWWGCELNRHPRHGEGCDRDQDDVAKRPRGEPGLCATKVIFRLAIFVNFVPFVPFVHFVPFALTVYAHAQCEDECEDEHRNPCEVVDQTDSGWMRHLANA